MAYTQSAAQGRVNSRQPSRERGIKNVKLQADDIMCSGCVSDIENILRDKEGILEASVNYADATITIRYDDKLIDQKEILATVRKIGLKSKIFR